jgi:hypothetical protein
MPLVCIDGTPRSVAYRFVRGDVLVRLELASNSLVELMKFVSICRSQQRSQDILLWEAC